MRVLILGKYPPIQGGASARTYWTAHALAKHGHNLHVVTNAKETAPPYRMFMRPEDWQRCENDTGPGTVTVHWTEDYRRREWHIPRGTTYVTKLAGLAFEVVKREAIDVIYSDYMEPYGVAAHLVAQATGIPHVVRAAGHDASYLWPLPMFRPVYDHICRSAALVASGETAPPRLAAAHVEDSRVVGDTESPPVCELFTPEGDALDVRQLRADVLAGGDNDLNGLCFGEFNPRLTYLGVYGKLGQAKGTYALLNAVTQMKNRGAPVGVLMMAHETPLSRDTLRDFLVNNRLEEHVCQFPFLPPWRVPEFIRRCAAVCCLEQDQPARAHARTVAAEVLACGGPLVASAEVIGRLPASDELSDGRDCIVVEDVNLTDDLEWKLTSVLEYPDRLPPMRERARAYACAAGAGNEFPSAIEAILLRAAESRAAPAGGGGNGAAARRQDGLHVRRTRRAVIEVETEGVPLLEGFAARIDATIDAISAYVGTPTRETIRIRLDDTRRTAVSRRAERLIIIPLDRLPDRSAVAHELTHLLAGPCPDSGSLWDEGLSVYLQEKFGWPGDRSFPAEGADLHRETARRMLERRRILPLSEAARVRKAHPGGPERRLAYLQEGSFIRYLVERHGIAPILSVYRGEATVAEAFAQPFEDLEAEWRSSLGV